RRVQRLLAVYSPRDRRLDRPEGRVDWLASRLASVGQAQPVYVGEVSGVGLGREERAALLGWCDWIAQQADRFAHAHLDEADRAALAPDLARLARLGADYRGRHDVGLRRRWAHTARRSRWPFLRQVVADGLAAETSQTAVDRLPVPADRPTAFELLVLVRLLSALSEAPPAVRWLANGNGHLRLPGIHAQFQRSFAAEQVRRAAALSAPAGEAITRFQVNLPTRSDLWIGFDRPRGGFDGVLVEVKSGGPQYRDTVLQLQTYRHALPDAEVQRALVLGVVEQPAQGPLRPSQAAWLAAQASGTDDVWAFCGPDDLAAVLAAVGLIKAPLADH
ncbi:MAG: hypothetical protein KC613_27605, partial [Myxococcales bacterium]|nr:hypothetical protein [Myxococcales bacterium]